MHTITTKPSCRSYPGATRLCCLAEEKNLTRSRRSWLFGYVSNRFAALSSATQMPAIPLRMSANNCFAYLRPSISSVYRADTDVTTRDMFPMCANFRLHLRSIRQFCVIGEDGCEPLRLNIDKRYGWADRVNQRAPSFFKCLRRCHT
jgi:hypothetical protein